MLDPAWKWRAVLRSLKVAGRQDAGALPRIRARMTAIKMIEPFVRKSRSPKSAAATVADSDRAVSRKLLGALKRLSPKG
jgi:hypothetical protein